MANSDKTTYVGGGILLPFLAVLFIGLKLTGQISWSWLWVLSPIWGPFAVGLAIALLCGLAAVFCLGIAAILSWVGQSKG